MKVLVTGATGFIGSHLTRMLCDAGYVVRALYRSRAKLDQFADLPVEALEGSLDDAASLELACAGCEIVCHVAAKADYWKDEDRAALYRINVDGTRNLLAAAMRAGLQRVLFTSSASTIGIRPGRELADESTAFNLPPERFYYAYTKWQAEAVVAQFVAQGMDIVTLNPAVVIGPGDLNAISGSFIIEAARWQWLTPMSSGSLAVIDVRDVARAHLHAITSGRTGERYILSARNLSYAQWFGLIAAACHVKPPLLATPDWLIEPTARFIETLRRLGIQTPMDANQVRLGKAHVIFDASKANREFGAPQIDIEPSLRDTYAWYQDHGYIKRDGLTRLLSWF